MNRILKNVSASLTHDDYEPAAEWLGGEAWVSPPPFTLEARTCVLQARDEQAATDWIAV